MLNNSTVDRILNSAETRARMGGYHAFSFREIAKEIGIKSASIHYHFPTKEALTLALTERYAKRFIEKINQIDTNIPITTQLANYIAIFREALAIEKLMCLCGVLSTESDLLPQGIKHAIQNFFTANLDWLKTRLQSNQVPQSDTKAAHILATLEGAMLLGKILESTDAFDSSVALLHKIIEEEATLL